MGELVKVSAFELPGKSGRGDGPPKNVLRGPWLRDKIINNCSQDLEEKANLYTGKHSKFFEFLELQAMIGVKRIEFYYEICPSKDAAMQEWVKYVAWGYREGKSEQSAIKSPFQLAMNAIEGVLLAALRKALLESEEFRQFAGSVIKHPEYKQQKFIDICERMIKSRFDGLEKSKWNQNPNKSFIDEDDFVASEGARGLRGQT